MITRRVELTEFRLPALPIVTPSVARVSRRPCELCRELSALALYGTIGIFLGLIIGLWIRS